MTEDEELITPKELLSKIETAWMNEMSSPDILLYKGDLIDLMSGQLIHMEESLQHVKTNDFRRIVHKMELERIRYVINSYLRIRLRKLESYSSFFINEDQNRADDKKRLAPSETAYAESYIDLMESHFKQLIFRHIPPQHDDNEKRMIRPNLMSNVFIKINSACGTLISSSNDEEISLSEKDNLHMLPYQIISELLINGNVDLI